MAKLSCTSKVTENNGTFFSDGPLVVANNGTVVLTANSVVNGTNITHTPGSDSIFLSPNKTYFVLYKCTTPSGTLSCQLLLNGIVVDGSITTIIPTLTQQIMTTSSVVINTKPSPDPNVLQLQNVSGVSKTLNEIAVTIIRLK